MSATLPRSRPQGLVLHKETVRRLAGPAPTPQRRIKAGAAESERCTQYSCDSDTPGCDRSAQMSCENWTIVCATWEASCLY